MQMHNFSLSIHRILPACIRLYAAGYAEEDLDPYIRRTRVPCSKGRLMRKNSPGSFSLSILS